MKVVFLGTAGYYPTEKRQTNCVLIKELNFILDAGTGFFRFPKFIGSKEIHIFLSHYHLDHVGGLFWLLGLFKGEKVNIYGSKGIKKFLTRFANQTAYRVDRKSTDEDLLIAYNPFLRQANDSTLQSLNSSLRNTFYFNQTNPKFGADYTYQDNRNKQLLTNGFESRINTYHEIRTRWNISKQFTFQCF